MPVLIFMTLATEPTHSVRTGLPGFIASGKVASFHTVYGIGWDALWRIGQRGVALWVIRGRYGASWTAWGFLVFRGMASIDRIRYSGASDRGGWHLTAGRLLPDAPTPP